MQDEITSAEFSEWLAYYSIEPFGEVRGDLQAGGIAMKICQALGSKNTRLADFMLNFDGGSRQQTVEEMQARIMIAARGNDGKRN